MQRPGLKAICGLRDCDSGLLHQRQDRGQPLVNTMVRMPGPSCTEYFWMLNTTPVVFLSSNVLMVTSRTASGRAEDGPDVAEEAAAASSPVLMSGKTGFSPEGRRSRRGFRPPVCYRSS